MEVERDVGIKVEGDESDMEVYVDLRRMYVFVGRTHLRTIPCMYLWMDRY